MNSNMRHHLSHWIQKCQNVSAIICKLVSLIVFGIFSQICQKEVQQNEIVLAPIYVKFD